MSTPNLDDPKTFKLVRKEFDIRWEVQRILRSDMSHQRMRYARSLRELLEKRANGDRIDGRKCHKPSTEPRPGDYPDSYLNQAVPGSVAGCPCSACQRARTAAYAARIPLALSPHCSCTVCIHIASYRAALKVEDRYEASGCIVFIHKRSGTSYTLYADDVPESFKDWTQAGNLRERLEHARCIETEGMQACAARVQAKRAQARYLPAGLHGSVYVNGSRVAISRAPAVLRQLAIERVYESKTPTTGEKYIGIEIECGFVDSYQREPIALAMARAGLSRHVNVGTDGSIRGFLSGIEVRILATEADLPDILARTCAVLKAHDARVNKSCGLHVHVDHRPATGRDPNVTYTKLVAAQRWLWAVVAPSRRGNEYVRRAKSRKLDGGGGHHYEGISARQAYRNHQTVEIRLHHGTTNAGKILNWVRLLLAVTDGPAITRCPGKLANFAKKLSLTPELTRWIAQRALVLGGADAEDLTVPADALEQTWTEDLAETREAEAGLDWESLEVSGESVERYTYEPAPVDAALSLAS